jgi:hypothetical protein
LEPAAAVFVAGHFEDGFLAAADMLVNLLEKRNAPSASGSGAVALGELRGDTRLFEAAILGELPKRDVEADADFGIGRIGGIGWHSLTFDPEIRVPSNPEIRHVLTGPTRRTCQTVGALTIEFPGSGVNAIGFQELPGRIRGRKQDCGEKGPGCTSAVVGGGVMRTQVTPPSLYWSLSGRRVEIGMTQFGKYLVLLGLGIAVVGVVVWVLGRSGFRGLPGDIRIETKNVKVYFPVVTCVVLSILLTLAAWLWTWLNRR